jgi:hypothetical protein
LGGKGTSKMKKQSSQSFLPFLFVLGLSLLIGCGAGATNGRMGRDLTANLNQAESGKKVGGREVAIGEHFTLNPDEKVSVKDTGLSLQLKTVRRVYLANGAGEYGDAEIIMTLDATEQTQWMKPGDKITVGDYVVVVLWANPFDKTSVGLTITHQ